MIRVLPLLLTLCVCPLALHATVASPKSMAIVCSGHRVSIPLSDRGWLPLNHRRGPCSPLRASSSESNPTAAMAVLYTSDQLRANRIHKAINSSTVVASKRGENVTTTVPTRLGSNLHLHTLEYVVTVGLGTPAVTQAMLMDTGSDVPWVQCEPCPSLTCHPENDAFFNPAMSATYTALRCGSAACKGLAAGDPDGGCSDDSKQRRRRRCQYVVSYGDGSNTTGTYGSDELTLAGGSFAVVRNFRFGCSHAAELFTDRAAGIMALGGGSPSLVSQLAETVFSYCLPPTPTYSGFLTLGVPPPPASASSSSSSSSPSMSKSFVVTTPMYKIDNFYVVLMEGIAVAGRRLRVPATVFAAGAVMDSGTVVTRLPPEAYHALRTSFRKEMKKMMYTRVAPPSAIFDTCYNLTGGEDDVKVPGVSLVFERGATVELDRSGVLLDGCLAFASNGDDEAAGIIGNVQQRTIEVMYDVAGGTVGFRRGAC